MKHALRLCGFFSAPLRVLVCLLFPFCKPLALLLDYVLGPSNQAVYSRQQLKALVDLQLEKGNVLTIDEAKILKGCLEMTSVVAESIMTPIESVVHIENGTTVTKEVVHNVAKAGFSTIPVITGGPDKSVTGFLGVKDLLLLDTAKSYRVMDLCDSIGKSIYAVDAENSVSDILPFFKGDSIHAVVVRKVFIDPQTSGDPIYKHVGIITVDDILRIMLQVSAPGRLSKAGQDYVTSGTESGRGGDELVKRRSEMQMRKHEKLNAMKTVHAFCLNAVAGIYPLPDPQAVLRALGLRECQENLDAVKARHVYLLKSGTLIPSGSMFVLLKVGSADGGLSCSGVRAVRGRGGHAGGL
ncbi:CBS domain-containing protein [Babesia caballi]|uniref:CBS domain-containing protein n=1 Tax=Babesia caballi TaxID=5871 RepID=A0AAV4LUN7_BABCB|nr:CBS domain-containing protein [Babesia caballi]